MVIIGIKKTKSACKELIVLLPFVTGSALRVVFLCGFVGPSGFFVSKAHV